MSDVEPPVPTVLFIQGGGAGTHDEWDDKLVASLARKLGPGFEVRYPRMPDEDDPSLSAWGPAIRRELAELEDGAVVVGHSIGATLLARALADGPTVAGLRAIVLISAPFVGAGGWPGTEYELDQDLGRRLPAGASVDLFHGLADGEVPPAHVELYATAIPGADVHRLPGRDHQLGDDLTEVAEVIRARSA